MFKVKRWIAKRGRLDVGLSLFELLVICYFNYYNFGPVAVNWRSVGFGCHVQRLAGEFVAPDVTITACARISNFGAPLVTCSAPGTRRWKVFSPLPFRESESRRRGRTEVLGTVGKSVRHKEARRFIGWPVRRSRKHASSVRCSD